MKDTVSTFVDERRGELLALLDRLVAAKTENPPGDEVLAASVVRDFFEARDIPFEMFESAPRRANIVGRVGRGKPNLLAAGHLDVVPAGDGWDGDPFAMRTLNDRVVGRGVNDNKGPLACLLLAGAFVREHLEPKGTLLLAGVADEERGSVLGLEWLLAEGKIAPDMAIIPDIGGRMRRIDVAEKGAVFLDIVSVGRSVHGSTPQKGVNAIDNMMDLLARLRNAPLLRGEHALLSPPTLNVGQIAGGDAPNMVPAKCEAKIDIRFLPGQTSDEILENVRRIARQAEIDIGGARFEVKAIAALPPTETSPDNDMVRHFRDAVFAFTGRKAEASGISGATVAKQLVMRGIPAIGVGAGDEGEAHVVNESIEVEELAAFTKVLAFTFAKLLGG